MKIIYVLGLFFLTLKINAQNSSKETDSTYLSRNFVAEVSKGTKGSDRLNDKCQLFFDEDLQSSFFKENIFLIEDYVLCTYNQKPHFYFKIFNGDRSYFIPVEAASVTNEKESNDSAKLFFSTLDAHKKQKYQQGLRDFVERRRKIDKLNAEMAQFEEDDKIIDAGRKVFQNALVVGDYSFPSEYSFVGFSIEVYNNSNKTIKYIYFNLAGYNAVDDRVYTLSGKPSITYTGIGPIGPKEGGSWNFETIWDGNQFDYGKVNSITVEYTNGTKQTFSNIRQLLIPDEYFKAVDRLKKWQDEHPEEFK